MIDTAISLSTRGHFRILKSGHFNFLLTTTSGRFFFHIMASLAQMERDLTAERTRAGLDAARRQGRTGGRKRKMDESKIAAAKRLLQDGTAPREVAKNLGVSIPTLYRWMPATAK